MTGIGAGRASGRPAPPRRPRAVVFDVNETLFSLEPVRDRLVALGLHQHALEWWFALTLRDGFALGALGGHASFADLAADALERVLSASGLEPMPDRVEHVLAAMGELEPHPDVNPALEFLAEAGVRAATLTNGDKTLTDALLSRAGLRHLVETCLSVDDVRRWKPGPEPYRHAAATLGLAPAQVAMVAVHAWDTAGAMAAGLTAGWASRLEGNLASHFPPADVTGATLVDVVQGLLDLPA